MRYQNHSGIVVRRNTTPNGDIVVSVITARGKLKGVFRKAAGKPNALKLNLFQHVAVQAYHHPNNDLNLITQVSLEGALGQLTQPELYPYAHLLCETADVLIEDMQDNALFFDLFTGSLRGIHSHTDPEQVCIIMLFKLLAAAGYAPKTSQCMVCGELAIEYFDPVRGGVLCGKHGSGMVLNPETAQFLQHLYAHTVRELLLLPIPYRSELWEVLERFIACHFKSVQSFRAIPALQTSV